MNISAAEPPKQCCLFANETIVKDVVSYFSKPKVQVQVDCRFNQELDIFNFKYK